MPQDTSLQIVSVLPDPAGKDAGNESVTIKNTSGSPVSLDGWKFSDSAGNQQKLDGAIPAGGTLEIKAAGRFSLNNTGDTISLINPQGTTTSTATYTKEQVKSGQSIRNTSTSPPRPPTPPVTTTNQPPAAQSQPAAQPPPVVETPPPTIAQPTPVQPWATPDPVPRTTGENTTIAALRSLGREPLGIDPNLISTLIQYEMSRDKDAKIALLKKADSNSSVPLLLRVTDPDNPSPDIPYSTIVAIQNIRNLMALASTFRSKDEYLDILPRTNWIAPPDGTIGKGFSKDLVEAIALAHAYERAPSEAVAERLANQIINLLDTGPHYTNSDFKQILSGPLIDRMPRLIRVYVATFARAEIAGAPAAQRQEHAGNALRSAHDVISANKFDTTDERMKDYIDAIRAANNKVPQYETISPRARSIAADIQAGLGRSTATSKTSSDAAQLKLQQELKKKRLDAILTELSGTKRPDAQLVNEYFGPGTSGRMERFVDRATAIRQAAVMHNPSIANQIPPVPNQMANNQQLAAYKKQVKIVVDANEKVLKPAQQEMQSGNAARGIGVMTAFETEPHDSTSRTTLGDPAKKPRKTSNENIDRIRIMDGRIDRALEKIK